MNGSARAEQESSDRTTDALNEWMALREQTQESCLPEQGMSESSVHRQMVVSPANPIIKHSIALRGLPKST